MRYIKSLKIVTGSNSDEEPEDSVESFGHNGNNPSDINDGVGAANIFAWLVPEYTEDETEAANGFKFLNTDLSRRVMEWEDKEKDQYEDLFQGTVHDGKAWIRPCWGGGKVTKVCLIRQRDGLFGPGHDALCATWSLAGLTTDINEGRGGEYLYLGWNTDEQPGA